MKILYGTTNNAKLMSMKKHLSLLNVEIIGINDIDCQLPEVDESGNTPLENARLKALAFYKASKMPVFSCDSGLFIEGISDEEQPSVHVRNVKGKCLSDDEMIIHYSSLATKMGGNMIAQYKNGICLVMDENNIYEYMGDDISGEKFIITDKPHEKRLEGFPLDSLSIHIKTGKYYYDIDNYKNRSSMDRGFQDFFKRTLLNNITVSFSCDDKNVPLKYVVITTRFNNQWVFVRHKNRNTYEIPGGHIEEDEDYISAAKRELYEETGAIDVDLNFVSNYYVTRGDSISGGYLFYGEIKEMTSLPDYEMAEVCLFDKMPNNLTYPQIQPVLYHKIQGWLNNQNGKGEIWDVYDEHRNLTGRTHIRGNQLPKGDYHLVVHAFIMNSKGELLITKRSPNKGFPNMWETTGGSAVTGDASLTAVVREIKEETGFDIVPENGKCLFSTQGTDYFNDVWFFKQDFDINDVVLQENETCDAKWATIEEIKKMIQNREFVAGSGYIDRVFDMISSDKFCDKKLQEDC